MVKIKFKTGQEADSFFITIANYVKDLERSSDTKDHEKAQSIKEQFKKIIEEVQHG